MHQEFPGNPRERQQVVDRRHADEAVAQEFARGIGTARKAVRVMMKPEMTKKMSTPMAPKFSRLPAARTLGGACRELA